MASTTVADSNTATVDKRQRASSSGAASTDPQPPLKRAKQESSGAGSAGVGATNGENAEQKQQERIKQEQKHHQMMNIAQQRLLRMELRYQLLLTEIHDKAKAVSPSVKIPFRSFDDAWERLYPYHSFDSVLLSREQLKQNSIATAKQVEHQVLALEELEADYYRITQKLRCDSFSTREDQLLLERALCASEVELGDGERRRRGRLLYPEQTISLVHGLRNSFVVDNEETDRADDAVLMARRRAEQATTDSANASFLATQMRPHVGR